MAVSEEEFMAMFCYNTQVMVHGAKDVIDRLETFMNCAEKQEIANEKKRDTSSQVMTHFGQTISYETLLAELGHRYEWRTMHKNIFHEHMKFEDPYYNMYFPMSMVSGYARMTDNEYYMQLVGETVPDLIWKLIFGYLGISNRVEVCYKTQYADTLDGRTCYMNRHASDYKTAGGNACVYSVRMTPQWMSLMQGFYDDYKPSHPGASLLSIANSDGTYTVCMDTSFGMFTRWLEKIGANINILRDVDKIFVRKYDYASYFKPFLGYLEFEGPEDL